MNGVFSTAIPGPDVPDLVARFCVLYEDLRIELAGVTLESLPELDLLDEDQYRRYYFLRRTILTLNEIADSAVDLHNKSAFKPILKSFPEVAATEWTKGVSYFNRQRPFLKKVRNDIGGHFGQEAAHFAVRNFPPDLVGLIEFEREGPRLTKKLRFAGDIAAVAINRHLKGSTKERQFQFLFRRLLVGYRHVGRMMDWLVLVHLWPRFG